MMEKYTEDPKTGLQYELQGDYYVIAGENEAGTPSIGTWGRRHLRWLKQNRRIAYTNLVTSGRLHEYLREIDTRASEEYACLIQQMAAAEGTTNQLKAADQMAWGARMNSIRSRAEEIVLHELVYSEETEDADT